MVTKEEALEIALDYINRTTYWTEGRDRHDTLKAVKEALAQPAQEPFGWYSAQEDEFMTDKIRKEHERLNSYTHIHGKFDLPLYTTPPQRPWIDEAAIRADEREACAKVAKQISDKYAYGFYGNEVDTADEIETAIRARGNT